MKYFKNDTASFHYDETVLPSVIKLCNLIKDHPFILNPFRGMNDKIETILSSAGFILYPTVKKTTLLYDKMTDYFLKILNPLTLKNSLFFILTNRANDICKLSEYLISKGIKVPKIMAYGIFKRGRRPFLVTKRVDGKSLYDILIREREVLPVEVYLKVVDEVARLHELGYWFGDAHLSHIFVKDAVVSGFIDIDNIRKNRPFRLKNLAKDLAGLNHPEVLLTEAEKKGMLNYYMDRMGIIKEEIFLQLIKRYTERRWKA